jgi:hypothetical protein
MSTRIDILMPSGRWFVGFSATGHVVKTDTPRAFLTNCYSLTISTRGQSLFSNLWRVAGADAPLVDRSDAIGNGFKTL